MNANNHVIASGKLYHAFVHDGWTFIVLNPYEQSSSLPRHTHGYKEAAKVLTEKNPNPVLSDEPCNFFEGLEGEGMRFVPFNGAVGETQRKWLAEVLSKAPGPCVVFSHLPLFHESCSWRNVAWDSPQVLGQVLLPGRRAIHHVVAVVAGHSHHRGGYARAAAVARAAARLRGPAMLACNVLLRGGPARRVRMNRRGAVRASLVAMGSTMWWWRRR